MPELRDGNNFYFLYRRLVTRTESRLSKPPFQRRVPHRHMQVSRLGIGLPRILFRLMGAK